MIPAFLFNEPRPHFPTFSERHDECEIFWLKFQLMAKQLMPKNIAGQRRNKGNNSYFVLKVML